MVSDPAFRLQRQKMLLAGDAGVNGIVTADFDRSPGRNTLTIEFLLPVNWSYGAPGEEEDGGSSGVLTAGALIIVPADLLPNPLLLSPDELETAGQHGEAIPVEAAAQVSANRVSVQLADVPAPIDYLIAVNAPQFDPVLKFLPFRFRPECDDEFDCKPQDPPDNLYAPDPSIDYLARDFQSLRRVLLDRMSLIKPDWTDRNPADPGVALIDLLAYVGDYLSYRQDFAATEGNFAFARLRSSLKRHVRLLGYSVDEGANARVAVQLKAPPGRTLPVGVSPSDLVFLTDEVPAEYATRPVSELGTLLQNTPVQFFEPSPVVASGVGDPDRFTVYPQHDRIPVHDWGDPGGGLAKGATGAFLQVQAEDLQLEPGDLLVLSPWPDDQNPALNAEKRHIVRVTSVSAPIIDPVGGSDGLARAPLKVQWVAWGRQDALPHGLPLGVRPDGRPETVALGNLLLADHGIRLESGETLPLTPDRRAQTELDADKTLKDTTLAARLRPRRYRPVLKRRNIAIQSEPVDPSPAISARALFEGGRGPGLPDISLIERDPDQDNTIVGTWSAISSSIEARETQKVFVAEIETDGQTRLRFGDGRFGQAPAPRRRFEVSYKIGSGSDGNVGAGAISELRSRSPASGQVSCWNPMSARGGRRRESTEDIRVRAPAHIRQQRRAITPEDYARRVMSYQGVQRAKALRLEGGVGEIISIAVDLVGGGLLTDKDRQALRRWVEPYRMMGHRILFRSPVFVPLDLALNICPLLNADRDQIRQSVQQRLSSAEFGDGERGFFHPDRLTFGAEIFASELISEVKKVPGVHNAEVVSLKRQRQDRPVDFVKGRLAFTAREIPILLNDRLHPFGGVLRIGFAGDP